MKTKLTSIAVALITFSLFHSAFCLSARAQGTTFTYSGRLENGGAPANGIYDLQFAIFDSSSGPAQVGGTLTNSATAVSNGLFSVTLDFGAGVFTGAPRWLEMGVRTNGAGTFTTLSPRQPITATPYAITAGNLTGPVASSQLSGTISSNNIGAGSITAVMLANGAVGSNQLATGAVTTSALGDDAVTATKVATVSNWIALTIANPRPETNDLFGWSVAAVGSNCVVIGAPYDNTGATDAGAAYLFSTNGTLLTTINNPSPATNEFFGISVAGVGNDRVLIGAYRENSAGTDAGRAYLYSTNGTFLATFSKPAPAAFARFGNAVAALGNDRVLIGAYRADFEGAAYLFRTNGTLLMTFTNPIPVDNQLGYAVAAVGSDLVLLGAPYDDTGAPDAGAAYLFSTNGTLLTAFTNPTPSVSDRFGSSVAALGNDRVLIGAYNFHTGTTNAGVAFLFSTNGTLLTTFTNPTPEANDLFGIAVAAVGSNRVLIGAYGDDTGATDAGAAYLFNTNGTLLTTFTKPIPAAGDLFGNSLAVLGNNRVLIGAVADDTGAADAGAAYLFSIESYNPGLVADTVKPRSITTASLEDGTVTAAKLDPTIGVWTRGAGDDVFRPVGNVGIGTATPANPLSVSGNANFTGSVGIGTTSPGAKLQVVGTDANQLILQNSADGNRYWHIYDDSFNGSGALVFYPSTGTGAYIDRANGSYNVNSDARLKQDIAPLDGVLDRVLQLRPVSYHFRSQPDSPRLTLGFIAQEVEPLFPEVVGEHAGMKSLAYSELVPVAVGAIQELNQKVEERADRLEKELKHRAAEYGELKQRLEKLERLMNQQDGGVK